MTEASSDTDSVAPDANVKAGKAGAVHRQLREIAHGLGGPASVIQGTIAGLRKSQSSGEFQASPTMERLLDLLESQIVRLEETAEDLRALSDQLVSEDPEIVDG